MKTVAGITYLTSEEMRRIDEVAIDEFGIDVMSLMENAGLQTAILARRMLGGELAAKRVTCLVGKGNNGGDGLVAARHLHDWGANVAVALGTTRMEFREISGKQLNAVERMGLSITEGATDLKHSDLLVDALLGYNSSGGPRGAIADLVRLANLSRVPILALDIPSGLDPTSGVPNKPCIEAKATITLGFPKTGFLNADSRPCVGELYLCDISLPREIYARHGGMGRIFQKESIIRVPTPR
jgi:NAD(P)H-hydrate epimerase